MVRTYIAWKSYHIKGLLSLRRSMCPWSYGGGGREGYTHSLETISYHRLIEPLKVNVSLIIRKGRKRERGGDWILHCQESSKMTLSSAKWHRKNCNNICCVSLMASDTKYQCCRHIIAKIERRNKDALIRTSYSRVLDNLLEMIPNAEKNKKVSSCHSTVPC